MCCLRCRPQHALSHPDGLHEGWVQSPIHAPPGRDAWLVSYSMVPPDQTLYVFLAQSLLVLILTSWQPLARPGG
jgi:hypothetical protein